MDKTGRKSYYEKDESKVFKSVNMVEDVNERSYGTYQRFLDLILSSIGLIFGIPLIFLFGIFIILDSPGSVFYSQDRLGEGGKVFKIYKLRSMVDNAEKNGAQWAEENDSRITRVGGFIRKTRIDEIPQLFNILKGDMSIVGPRPERPEFTMEFNDEIPGFVDRLQVKPGLTGWAQVNGGYDMTPKEKLDLDMYYIKNRSVKTDIIIIFKTVKVILTGHGAR